ncbi:MAG: hypothetical protein ABSF15_09900 [Candidatus Sulfotelmatobacter sp.]|jgi:hypothetical protein
MRKRAGLAATWCLLALQVMSGENAAAQTKEAARNDAAVAPALTIYNQQFAVVRHGLALDLNAGQNHVAVTDITGHVEPDSVFLRSLDESRHLRILEQNYRNDPVSELLLLSLYEGKTIDFLTPDKTIVQGKIIRSGFVPHATVTYGQRYYQAQGAYLQQGAGQPVIEVNGKLQFTLPGQPLFPALGDDTVLKPTLSWELETDKAGKATAELSYVTGGMNWEASYNVVSPTKGADLDLVGWVTLDNQSGETFRDARIKLMAGDVNKIQTNEMYMAKSQSYGVGGVMAGGPEVTEKAFDEYHLYTLERPTTLHDRETKQVEFVRAAGVKSKTVYVYDGWKVDANYRNWTMETIRTQDAFGTQSNSKVWVMQEFKNSAENHLGIPLPKGRVRFYRRDDDGQLEFTGENEIDHTPKDELIRIYTGNAFDLTGERRRLDYKLNTQARWVDESFEIKVRNHKSTPAEVRIVEHLYRWNIWDISKSADPFKKVDAQTAAFVVEVPPDGEKVVTYQVHYSW